MIKESSLQKVKDLDIVSIIEGRIDLKKNGANLKACCPFHNENSPSFVVSPAKQIFKCFGCNKAGDAIIFVKNFDNISYYEAVKKIAFENKIELEFENTADFDAEKYSKREEMKSLFKVLQSEFSEKEEGAKYYQTRGLNEDTCKFFGIGYCNGSEFKNELAKEIGLTNEKGNHVYYKRATVPICDRVGNVIAFAGRKMDDNSESTKKIDDNSKPPKWINSAENELYVKDNILYNWHNAINHIREKGVILLSEGYSDTQALHQAGYKNGVSYCGSYISEKQLALIKGLNIERLSIVLFCDFDIDKKTNTQDFKKIIANLKNLVSIGEIRLVMFTDFKDIGEYAVKHPTGIENLIKQAPDGVGWYCNFLIGKDKTAFEISYAQDDFAKLMANITKENLRNIYIKENADVMNYQIKEMKKTIEGILNVEEKKIDFTDLEYVKVRDNFYQKVITHDLYSNTYDTEYKLRDESHITKEKNARFTSNIPKFTGWATVPSHTDYKSIVWREYNGLKNVFLNKYHELAHKPLPFEFDIDAEYESVKEIKTIAMFFNHIANKKKYGDRFVEMLWDYITIKYRFPTQKLPILCLVSKEEGTGKSKLIELLLEIFGNNATPITTDRLTKNFNSIIEGKSVATIEETSDERGDLENFLKDFATGQNIIIEKKGIDSERSTNFCCLVLASNKPTNFLKVSDLTTRYAVLYVPKVEKVNNNLLDKMIEEIPYFLHFILKRKIKTPNTNRLWFEPTLWDNEALNNLRQTSKDVVVKAIEDLVENIFLRTQYASPFLRLSSESLKKLLCIYSSNKYSNYTSNFFSETCREKMGLYQALSVKSFKTLEIIVTDTISWANTETDNKTRFLEFPIWKFCSAESVKENYSKDKLDQLDRAFNLASNQKVITERCGNKHMEFETILFGKSQRQIFEDVAEEVIEEDISIPF